MRLDAGLDSMEDGYVTEAEQVDQETEIEDMQSLLDDDIMDPDSLDTDMEGAYEGFHDNEGFKGIPVGGYTDSQLEDAVRDETGLDLPEEVSNDTSEVTLDEAEPIDYGFDVERFSSSDGVEENTTDVIAQAVDEEA